MTETSLEKIFFPSASDISAQMAFTQGDINMSDLRHAIGALPFNTAYDFFRAAVDTFIQNGQIQQAIDYINSFDALATRVPD